MIHNTGKPRGKTHAVAAGAKASSEGKGTRSGILRTPHAAASLLIAGADAGASHAKANTPLASKGTDSHAASGGGDAEDDATLEEMIYATGKSKDTLRKAYERTLQGVADPRVNKNQVGVRKERVPKMPRDVAVKCITKADHDHWFKEWLSMGRSWATWTAYTSQEEVAEDTTMTGSRWMNFSQMTDYYKSREVALAHKARLERGKQDVTWAYDSHVPDCLDAMQYYAPLMTEDTNENTNRRTEGVKGDADIDDEAAAVLFRPSSRASSSTPSVAGGPFHKGEGKSEGKGEGKGEVKDDGKDTEDAVRAQQKKARQKKREREAAAKLPESRKQKWLNQIVPGLITACAEYKVRAKAAELLPGCLNTTYHDTFKQYETNLKSSRTGLERAADADKLEEKVTAAEKLTTKVNTDLTAFKGLYNQYYDTNGDVKQKKSKQTKITEEDGDDDDDGPGEEHEDDDDDDDDIGE